MPIRQEGFLFYFNLLEGKNSFVFACVCLLFVLKVMGMNKVRSQFRQFEKRRQLMKMFDLFAVDVRVGPSVSNVFGSTFLSKKKYNINNDIHSLILFLKATNQCLPWR